MTKKSTNHVLRSQLAAAAALIALIGSSAAAQERTVPYPRLNIERFTLNADGRDSLVVDTGSILGRGETRISLAAQYAGGQAVTRVGDDYASLRLDNRLLGSLAIAHAPATWLQLEAQLPVIFNQTESAALSEKGFAPVSANGLGAPLVGARFSLLRQRDNGPLDLAAGATVGIPVGDADALGNDPQAPFRAMVSAGYDFGSLKLGGQLYAQLRSQENFGYRGVSPSMEDTVNHELGGALALSSELMKNLRAELDVVADYSLQNAGSSVLAMAGVRYQAMPNLEVFAAAGPGFGDLVGTPRYRVFGGVAYNVGGGAQPQKQEPVKLAQVEPPKPPPDADSDGVLDADDKCVGDAEDKDGFEDADGCPDPDNDGDGLADAKDACPGEKGELHRAGCPAPDTDGDTLADDVDRCPAEKGEVAEQGCPPKDSDGDKVADKVDLCPQKAAPEGSTSGCPDTDGDGLEDNADNCVVERGPEKNHGCPARQKQLVVITKEKLQILDKVYFANARATVLPKSRLLLNQIAKILKEHPEIEKVVVEGHTDDRGKDETNLKLSQARADAVRKYLLTKGVAPDRVEAKGYGETKPVQENSSKAGREANRRVEFVIVSGEQDDSLVPVEPLQL